MRGWRWGVLAASLVGLGACGGGGHTAPPRAAPKQGDIGADAGSRDAGTVGEESHPDAGVEDAGVVPDGGLEPDAGVVTDGGERDGGTSDGGTAEAEQGPGPWPTDPILNYTERYGLGQPQSVGVDAAHNVWLLDGASIGVLPAGGQAPIWVSGLGQARDGFGADKLAEGSTVICGGAANQAYVGYFTYDLQQPERTDPNDPEFKKGDMDVVQLNPDGTLSLTTHLHESAGASNPSPAGSDLGIRNTNDWHYDEDRSVLTCATVRRGPNKGDVYSGSNHGVTRIRGLRYDAHRHAVWEQNGSLMIGYNYAVGIAPNGDVLIGNAWKVGIITPPQELLGWTDYTAAPFKLDTYDQALNSLEELDYWRGFQQTSDGEYYLGSLKYGLWQMEPLSQASASWTKIAGLPTDGILSLASTDDGSLFIGTDGAGLWWLDPQKQLMRVNEVSGGRVLQLVYDPTVSPAMLYVLTDAGLTVLRGY